MIRNSDAAICAPGPGRPISVRAVTVARAGLTDQRDRLAGLDRQVEAADVHLAAAPLEPDLQVADLQDWLRGGFAHRFLRS